jgi:hypothetical protein
VGADERCLGVGLRFALWLARSVMSSDERGLVAVDVAVDVAPAAVLDTAVVGTAVVGTAAALRSVFFAWLRGCSL